MKDYVLYAQKYPAIIGMLLPSIITAIQLPEFLPQLLNGIHGFASKLCLFIPVAVVYAAIGYFARQAFRDTSKFLFQFPLFKQDESEMPTTHLLLHTDKRRLSKSMLDQISIKVEKEFGIKLLDEAEEKSDLSEAKRTIVDAVGKMRESTRKNANLQQYNIDFGFCRNYLGATVYAVAILLVIMIVNIALGIGTWQYTLLALIVQLFCGIIAYATLKYKGYAYAKSLFNAYLSGKEYEW